MGWLDGADPLDHGGFGIINVAILEGDDPEAATHEIQKLSRLQQEVPIRRPAEPFVARRKGLVEQHAARIENVENGWEQRSPEVVGHDYRSETPPRKGPWSAFEISDPRRDAGHVRQLGNRLRVPIHRLDLEAQAGQMTTVTTETAGKVQNRPSDPNQRGVAHDPRRGRVDAMVGGSGHERQKLSIEPSP